MAASAAFTNTNASSTVRIIRIAWTADSTGNLTIVSPIGFGGGVVIGALAKRGTPPPANNYRVTVKDHLGADMLNGVGVNGLSNTIDHQFAADDLGGGVGYADSVLTIVIGTAGADAQGEIVLYLG